MLLYKTWKYVEECEFSTYQKDIFFPFFVSFTVVFTSILIFQYRSNHIDQLLQLKGLPSPVYFFILLKLKDLILHFHLDHSYSHIHNRYTHYA